MAVKSGTSFRLTKEARKLLAVTAKRMGIAKTAVIETAIRQIAKEMGIA